MKRSLVLVGLLALAAPQAEASQSMPKCTAWVSDFLPGAIGQLRKIIKEECGSCSCGTECAEAAIVCEDAAVTCQQTCGDVTIPPIDELCGSVSVEEGIAAVQAGYTRCRVKQGRNRLRVQCLGVE